MRIGLGCAVVALVAGCSPTRDASAPGGAVAAGAGGAGDPVALPPADAGAAGASSVSAGGAGGADVSGRPSAPVPLPGFDDALRLPELTDADPDPRVLDVSITTRVAQANVIAAGPAELWTYEGHSPGPLLRARVGDRLIVRLHNALPDATTIHWHGLEVPAAMDGALTGQPAIEPGTDFTYDFTLPRAGLYWYHPHVRSAEQLFRGLYGAIVVEDPDEPFRGHEVVLVLHDIDLEDDGSLGDPRSNGGLGDFFGREGGYVLVNGRIEPTLRARPGEPLRLRIVNAASSRHFRLAVDGHTLHRIGGDNGAIERTESLPELLLVPGERADVVLVPEGVTGDTLALRDLGHDRLGCAGACALPERDLVQIALEGEAAATPWPPPQVQTAIETLPLELAAQPERIELGQAEADDEGGQLTINGVVFAGEHAHEPLLKARVGETRSYLLLNTTDYDHPFHLHGFRFQVLDRDGEPPALREWEDTIFLPAQSRARIAVSFDDRPGDWMFHCHILDHAEIGMMGVLRVLPAR